MDRDFDIIIVGGGITGASILFTLSRFSKAKRILLIEKYNSYAQINSNSRNNAQTLHFGDIETNYTIDKARKVKQSAEVLLKYINSLPRKRKDDIMRICQKMVLAVGEEEIGSLEKTFSKEMHALFPSLKMLTRKEIAMVEPAVVKGRKEDEKISSLYSRTGYMVDFGKLTKSFASDADSARRANKPKAIFGTKVTNVQSRGDSYVLHTNKGEFSARFVIFAAGSYSLYFAKSMGYDKNLSILSVGGNFYYSRNVLRGKVYRVQIGGVPFAAVHADPDITNPNVTRFGPTVTVPPELERYHFDTFRDYFRTFDIDLPTIISLKNIFLSGDTRDIILRNATYDIPIIGKYAFLKKEVQKIVPSLGYSDIRMAGKIGGIRPQLIDKEKRELLLGESKIRGDNIIFNVTPSPGATSCLYNSLGDAKEATDAIGVDFDEHGFKETYCPFDR